MIARPTLHTAAIAALEQTVNAALALSPHSRPGIAALAGQVIAIDCTAPPFVVYLLPTGEGRLALRGVHEGPVATRVRGAAGDFAELAGARDPAAALVNGQLSLEGNSAPLTELSRIVADLDVDWEAPLVNTLGDVVGHQLAGALRGLFRFGREAERSLTRQLDEFVHEEARLTPPRAEVEDFYRDVQSLGLAVDRLAARLDRARARLGRLGDD